MRINPHTDITQATIWVSVPAPAVLGPIPSTVYSSLSVRFCSVPADESDLNDGIYNTIPLIVQLIGVSACLWNCAMHKFSYQLLLQ